MTLSIEEYQQLITNTDYAKFVHTNLHLHTPAVKSDWDSQAGQTHKASELTPEIYFDSLNKTTLDLVAITDHNCILWCEPLINIAKKARREGKSKIYVLPGIELTTYEGPHLQVIFDENQDLTKIGKMLTRLGIEGKGEAEDKVGPHSPKPVTINDIFEEVKILEGIIIAPHVDSEDGLWGCKDFRGRTEILNDQRLKILAAPSGQIKRVVEHSGKIRLLYKNMDTEKITNSFSFINVSDCHRLEDFETNCTWIKMTKPSLNGVRQIIYEPELRVSNKIVKSAEKVEYPDMFYFEQNSLPVHPTIIGMCIDGGMLNGINIKFSPHQNSIIGTVIRGFGKEDEAS